MPFSSSHVSLLLLFLSTFFLGPNAGFESGLGLSGLEGTCGL